MHADASGTEGSGATEIHGRSPRELEAAAAAVRRAYAAHDRQAVIDGLADLAIAATDLSDPFLVTSLEPTEEAGSRAAFSDLLAGSLAISLEMRGSLTAAAPLERALRLAEESAGYRDPVEHALASADFARLTNLRRERLESALALGSTIAREAWQAAGEPTLDTAVSRSVLVWPNPVRSEAQLSFALPTQSVASLELFDLAGRRVWSKSLGALTAGGHSARLPASATSSLPPGVYHVRLAAPHFAATGRLTLQSR
jgi:hypothetical protein